MASSTPPELGARVVFLRLVLLLLLLCVFVFDQVVRLDEAHLRQDDEKHSAPSKQHSKGRRRIVGGHNYSVAWDKEEAKTDGCV